MSIDTQSAKERAYERFVGLVEKDARKAFVTETERTRAIAATFGRWLENLPETTRADIFAGLEAAASAPDARKIATHPLRPGSTDARLAELATKPSVAGKASAETGNGRAAD